MGKSELALELITGARTRRDDVVELYRVGPTIEGRCLRCCAIISKCGLACSTNATFSAKQHRSAQEIEADRAPRASRGAVRANGALRSARTADIMYFAIRRSPYRAAGQLRCSPGCLRNNVLHCAAIDKHARFHRGQAHKLQRGRA